MILRQIRNDEYIVVGEAYIYQMMQGQNLLGPLPPGVCDLFTLNGLTGECPRVGFIDVNDAERVVFGEDPRLPAFFDKLKSSGYDGPHELERFYQRDFISDLRKAGFDIQDLTLV